METRPPLPPFTIECAAQNAPPGFVIPAKAGIQGYLKWRRRLPAFAGMTKPPTS